MSTRKFDVEIPVATWQEDDQFVAWSPALDLASQGDTEEQALRNFGEALDLFFETAIERGTLDEL